MTFRTVCRSGLPASSSPFRVVDEQERELEWINRFLDMQCVRGIAPLTLRSYAHALLHFVRWWSRQPGVDITRFTAEQFTESTLVDYVRDQLNAQPKPGPENVNNRSWMLRRLFRFYFHQDMPHAPYQIQRAWWRRSALGYGRGGPLLAQLPYGARSGHRGFDAAQRFALARARAPTRRLVVQRSASARARQGVARSHTAATAGNHAYSPVLAEDGTAAHQRSASVRIVER